MPCKQEMRRCSNLLSTPSHTWSYLAEDNTSRHLIQTTRLVYGYTHSAECTGYGGYTYEISSWKCTDEKFSFRSLLESQHVLINWLWEFLCLPLAISNVKRLNIFHYFMMF